MNKIISESGTCYEANRTLWCDGRGRRGVWKLVLAEGWKRPFQGTGAWLERRSKLCKKIWEKNVPGRGRNSVKTLSQSKVGTGKGWGMSEGRQGLDCAGQRATCLRDQVGPFLFSKDCQVGPSSEHMILSQRTATVGATNEGRACWEVLSPQINSINANPSHPPPDNKRGSEAALGERIVCNGCFSSSLTPKP